MPRGDTVERGRVFWVNFDPARGDEIRKARPAVIVSNLVTLAGRESADVPPGTLNSILKQAGLRPQSAKKANS